MVAGGLQSVSGLLTLTGHHVQIITQLQLPSNYMILLPSSLSPVESQCAELQDRPPPAQPVSLVLITLQSHILSDNSPDLSSPLSLLSQLQMTEEWGVAWAWVAGYSAVSTLVIIFNIVIAFSVLSNRYLHYSYNYVIVMLSLRFEKLYISVFDQIVSPPETSCGASSPC